MALRLVYYAASRGIATLSNLDMQQCPKTFCNNVQKYFAILSKKCLQKTLSSFFNTYEPWQYKFRLNKILTEINDIVTDGKYMIRNSPKDFAEISQRLEACIALFEECEQHYKKEILLRVVTNKAVQIFLLLFVALIIVLIIAA